MICEHCNLSEWNGVVLPPYKVIDGKHQDFEVTILDDVEYEGKALHIDGTHTTLLISIKFCPMCGRKL